MKLKPATPSNKYPITKMPNVHPKFVKFSWIKEQGEWETCEEMKVDGE